MKKYILVLFILTGLLSSCIVDDSDQPPINGSDPDITPTITIAALKAMYTVGTSMQLDDSLIISGIVVADDQTGNFYKSIAIQDSTGGILIRMNSSTLYTAYPVGRKVFIKLGGLWMGDYGGLIQIGGAQTLGSAMQVDAIAVNLFDTYIFKGTVNNVVVPTDVTITGLNDSYQNMLIRIPNVQFIAGDTNKQYAPGVSQNILLEDCAGNSVIVRTSGYCTFAYDFVPNNNGEFVGIYSYYSPDKQLMIRNTADLKMNGVRCGPYAKKDFEDGSMSSGGWTIQQVVEPGVTWTTGTIGVDVTGGTTYGKCSNYYASANHICETWYISPSFDLTSGVNPVMTFINACNYSGANVIAKVSSNYVSGDPNAAVWTTLSPTLSTGSWAWVSSGNLNLSAFNGQSNVHIAFEYTGTNSDGKTWEIDNILVIEQ